MATDERARHELYLRLEEALGAEPATTLMEHLPPTGWADVATKSDLAALEERLELSFARIDDRFGAIDDRFRSLEETFDLRLQTMESTLLGAFRGEILNAISSQTRPFLISITTMFVLYAGFITAIKIT